ncbi:anti-sigma factor [Rhizobium sp. CG5]|uniref:anti-sigma factor family protein n=1 Tax=Rhizobium sp. CG5 TaxID=2726076 RepID=UPI00203445CD|nr:anti-sigma factor [Rhizobium sp. CG5]MCM2475369.1 anti-sigma factor [Rhizobium sp. CG5]
MTDMPILDTELDAYVDNQLDRAARIRVERYLGKNPDAAARVMADTAIRNHLRLAMDLDSGLQRAETREAARRLSAGLGQKRLWTKLQRIAAMGLLLTTGWIASSYFGPFAATSVIASVHPPAFVDQAIQAHQTSLLRASMLSQPETAKLDVDDIRSATAIVLPKLPDSWAVVDVQVFPSNFGPSVELSIKTSDDQRLSLFAVRPGFFAVEKVASVNVASGEAAYWQIGEVAYALVSSQPNSGLLDEAALLSKTLY